MLIRNPVTRDIADIDDALAVEWIAKGWVPVHRELAGHTGPAEGGVADPGDKPVVIP